MQSTHIILIQVMVMVMVSSTFMWALVVCVGHGVLNIHTKLTLL